MKEVKSPKKPLIYYYCIVLLIVLLFNLLVTPLLSNSQVVEVDYGTFMDMIEAQNIGFVQVEDTQILFTDKEGSMVYQTTPMEDPTLTERLHDSGAEFRRVSSEPISPIWSFLLTFILPMLIFIGLGQYMSKKLMEQAGGMYYRLLAPHLLLCNIKRILYLDPDILVINPIRGLWETALQGNLFAAAAHTGKTELAHSVNRLRLGTKQDYYNSGVLLMDLDAGRQEIDPGELFRYAELHREELLLPDQDILNALYGERILPVEDVLWNYDARNYSNYLLRSGGVYDLQWVMKHTAILHFCGKAKPWSRNYFYRFGVLYRHYMQLTSRTQGDCFDSAL